MGEREEDLAYERGALKRCEKTGIEVRQVVLPENVSQEALIASVEELNRDGSVHGVLVFCPLPGHLDEAAVRCALDPKKDVDGITDSSLLTVFTGRGEGYPPCTAAACMEILEHYGYAPEGKRAVVVGRSLVIGKPAAMLLIAKNATVTVCHTKTADLPAECSRADILIAAAGRAGAVGADCVSPGQVVIDVGINIGAGGDMCGDADFDAVEPVVAAITPVPGGVGAVTTSVLVSHVVKAAAKSCDNQEAGV